MSLNTPALLSKSDSPASPAPGAGAAGAFWMLTIGVAKSLKAACQSVTAGTGVVIGAIDVGSSVFGNFVQSCRRSFSIFSQALQAPWTASANTPLVGTLIR